MNKKNNQNNVKNTVKSNQNTVENNQNNKKKNQNHDFTIKKSFKRKTYCQSESGSDTYTVSKSEIVRESETDSDDTVIDKIVVSL